MSTMSSRSRLGGLRAHIVNQGEVWHPDIWNTKIIIIIILFIIIIKKSLLRASNIHKNVVRS